MCLNCSSHLHTISGTAPAYVRIRVPKVWRPAQQITPDRLGRPLRRIILASVVAVIAVIALTVTVVAAAVVPNVDVGAAVPKRKKRDAEIKQTRNGSVAVGSVCRGRLRGPSVRRSVAYNSKMGEIRKSTKRVASSELQITHTN